MKIVFDFRKYDGVVGGVEQGVIQITKYITSIDHSVVILCKKNRLEQVENIFKDHQNLKIIPLNVSTHAMSLRNVKLDSITIQDIALSEQADIIHFFYNWSFPLCKKVPSILTVHDVIPFTFREAMGLFRNIFLYKPGIRKACRLNDIIATVSNYSKQDIAEKVRVPFEKIRVVPNGLREANPKDPSLEKELKNRFAINEEFVLNVGGIHERKNIVKLIHAFAGLVNHRGYSGKLLITGNVSGAPYQRKMKKICDDSVRETGMGNRIVFTGYVSEQELDSLFRMAGLLIYPSLYEGFGMPILEAMKMGLAVITSNVTAMPEVAGGAAYLVDPNSIEDMTSAMSEVLQNKILREEMIEKGLGLVHPYTWKNVSDRYLELYQELIEPA